MQEYDLLAIKVKDLTGFGVKPFPLSTWLSREKFLKDSEVKDFCIVHIPSDKDGKLVKPEVTMGPKHPKNTDATVHCKLCISNLSQIL